MPGTRCAVAVCNNSLLKTKNNKSTANIRYYSFPKEPGLRKIWVNKCRRVGKWNPSTSRICSKHFKDDNFERDMQAELLGLPERKVLKFNAVPTENLLQCNTGKTASLCDREARLCRRNRRKTAQDIIASTSVASEGNEMPEMVNNQNAVDVEISPIQEDTPRNLVEIPSENINLIKNLKARISFLEKSRSRVIKQRKQKDTVIRDVKVQLSMQTLVSKRALKDLKALKTKKNKKAKYNSKLADILRVVFSDSQIKRLLGKKRVNWGSEDLKNAFTLRYFSKRAYVFLKKDLHIPLPGLSTLRAYASKLNLRQGILTDVLNLMKVTGSVKPTREKLAVLTFDEMKVQSQYEYDVKADQVVGKHEQMQVAMVRGLYGNWKQPIYIGFDQKMTKTLLLEIITKLHEAGYLVVSTVCDMGGGNMGLWRELGVNINRNWFYHPSVSEQLIYCFADAPHALKLIRNWLLDKGFILEDGDVDVNRKPLDELLKLDFNELKMCHKLRAIHLECRGPTRQNVKLAAQLLSNNVSKALYSIYISKKQSHSSDENLEDYQNLSKFIEKVNAWFQIFNSYTENDPVKIKCAFGVHLTEQLEALNEMSNLIDDMRCKGTKCLQIFQKGLLISIKSLKDLYFDLKNKFGYKYILTHRLNQDCLENFFSQVRTRGGLNDHPTPLNSIYRIRMIILGKNPGVCHQNSNTSDLSQSEYLSSDIVNSPSFQEGEYVLASAFKKASIEPINPDCSTAADLNSLIDDNKTYLANSDSSKTIKNTNELDESDFSKLEENGIELCAGWLAKKHNKKFPDLNLTETKTLSDHSYELPSWANFLSYGGLAIPSSSFLATVNTFESVFRSYLPQFSLSNEPNLVKNISDLILQSSSLPKELVQSFVKLRVFIRIKFLNNVKKTDAENGDSGRKKAKKMNKIIH